MVMMLQGQCLEALMSNILWFTQLTIEVLSLLSLDKNDVIFYSVFEKKTLGFVSILRTICFAFVSGTANPNAKIYDTWFIWLTFFCFSTLYSAFLFLSLFLFVFFFIVC